MRFINRLQQRLSGAYRLRERKYAPIARKRILEMLEKGEVSDSRLEKYLRSLLPYLEYQKKLGDMSVWIGAPTSKTLFRLMGREAVTSMDYNIHALKPWYDDKTGLYDFGVVRLVPPVNDDDANVFCGVFNDLVIGRLLGDGGEDIVRFLNAEGDYEQGEVVMRPGDVVLDCGANMGFFSALAARRGCRAFAFEPSRYIRDTYLTRNAKLNGNVEVLPYALSDQREELRFLVERSNIGSSKRTDNAQGKALAAAPSEDVETVEAVTIDDFVAERGLERVDFIKADIEGSERLMLRGAKNVLAKFAPKLSICTYHLPDDPRVLRDIILASQPRYRIVQGEQKLYAWVSEPDNNLDNGTK